MTKKQINVIWLNVIFLALYAVWIMLTQGGVLPTILPINELTCWYNNKYFIFCPGFIGVCLLFFIPLVVVTIKILALYYNEVCVNSQNADLKIVKTHRGIGVLLWIAVYVINLLFFLAMCGVCTAFAFGPFRNIWSGVYYGIVLGVIPMAIFVVGLIGFIKTISQIVKCNKKRNSV